MTGPQQPAPRDPRKPKKPAKTVKTVAHCQIMTSIAGQQCPPCGLERIPRTPRVCHPSRAGARSPRAVRAREPSTPIKLAMSGEGLSLSASAQDVGNAFEQLDAKYEGEELTVAFNPEYLIDGLEVATGDEVTLETVDALKPALLKSIDSTDFLYLLMPVRVS